MKRIIPVMTLIVVLGCGESRSYEPTDREELLLKAYAALLTHHGDFGRTTSPDSLALYQDQTDSILDSFSFTREEFRSEFGELINSPERFEPLFQKIYADLQEQARK